MLARRKDPLKTRPLGELTIILEDLGFSWFKHEISKVKELWALGEHIADIAKAVNRDQDEVALLIMHLARNRKIRKRQKGVFGN